MLKLPGNLSAAKFLSRHWQKAPLFVPGGLDRIHPAVTRNELGWLATLDDVESRLVFTHRDGDRASYTAETGPFEPEYLVELPQRDWTLLVHDVEKHLPAMRRLFTNVPFIPDWRIDDLMISFAAPGGGVGPHRDNYDVFLCQGIGTRKWHVTTDKIPADAEASSDLALIAPFSGQSHAVRQGDILYLPPGVAHWGTATRACITYSIGMRAPQLSDLLTGLPDDDRNNPFYADPDLAADESVSGYLSPESLDRALDLVGTDQDPAKIAAALGRYVTQTKHWITPDGASEPDVAAILRADRGRSRLVVHGMARIAWDDHNVYANGACRARSGLSSEWLETLCRTRELSLAQQTSNQDHLWVAWMLKSGVFELPEIL